MNHVHYHSDISPNATERETECEVIPFTGEVHRHVELVLDGKVVGKRIYNENGTLILEEPLKDGRTHGTKYWWNDDSSLQFLEPYHEGLVHGTAIQFDPAGNVIGTYTMIHGTGFDVWRQPDEEGIWRIAEIHSWKDGNPHGYERWLNPDETLWHERHWNNGEWHGIERMWDDTGKMCRGYPRYWIDGKKVNKQRYLRACHKDPHLPPYREEDDAPNRTFLEEIDINSISQPTLIH